MLRDYKNQWIIPHIQCITGITIIIMLEALYKSAEFEKDVKM